MAMVPRGPFQQVLLGAGSRPAFTSAPTRVYWALGSQVTLRNSTVLQIAALVTGGKRPWRKPQPGNTSSPATVWTCYVKLGPPSPLGLSGTLLEQNVLDGPERSDTLGLCSGYPDSLGWARSYPRGQGTQKRSHGRTLTKLTDITVSGFTALVIPVEGS